MQAPSDTAAPHAPRDFRTTHWSLVLEAGSSTADGQAALETLCRHYWYPLYAFTRRRGHEPADAEDLTQEFFAQLLAGSGFAGVHPDKGRFRTFLLAALKNFLAKEWHKANRLKRGGGREMIAWDALEPEARYRLEPGGGGSDEVVFDQQWAHALIAGVLARLRAEAEREGLVERFDVLKNFLSAEPSGDSYRAAAQRLALSEPAVKSAIHRLRRRYAALLRDEIMNTVPSVTEVDDEIRHLFAALSA